jgi:hypothetical protein
LQRAKSLDHSLTHERPAPGAKDFGNCLRSDLEKTRSRLSLLLIFSIQTRSRLLRKNSLTNSRIRTAKPSSFSKLIMCLIRHTLIGPFSGFIYTVNQVKGKEFFVKKREVFSMLLSFLAIVIVILGFYSIVLHRVPMFGVTHTEASLVEFFSIIFQILCQFAALVAVVGGLLWTSHRLSVARL